MSHDNTPSLPRVRAALLIGAAGLLCAGPAAADRSDAPAPAKSTQPAKATKGAGSGVSMTAQVPKSIAIGQPTAVTLTFDRVAGDGAVALLRAPTGVTLARADGAPLGEIALLRGAVTRIDLLVTAQGDGTQYLSVTTRQGGRASVQSVALRVGSGAPQTKSNGTPQTTPAGEKIISMPAR